MRGDKLNLGILEGYIETYYINFLKSVQIQKKSKWNNEI